MEKLADECHSVSKDLETIVAEEREILNSPSPPNKKSQISRLTKLNNTANLDINRATLAYEDYVDTVQDLATAINIQEKDMVERAGKLEKGR